MAKPKIPADGAVNPRVAKGFDRLMSVQRPVVLAHIRSIRSRHPDASPAQVIAILERRYLTAVTTGGAAVGASAAIPAIGTGTSLALSGVETAGLLEVSALYAQSVTEVHGIAIDDPDRARTLVMTMMLGEGGVDVLQQFALQAAGKGAGRTAYWGTQITKAIPTPLIGELAKQLQKRFLTWFAARQGTTVVGRLVPFGVGAAIGGVGNHLLARQVVRSSREAFGPAPAAFPADLALVGKPPKAPREAKVRAPGSRLRLVRPRRWSDAARRRPAELEPGQSGTAGSGTDQPREDD